MHKYATLNIDRSTLNYVSLQYNKKWEKVLSHFVLLWISNSGKNSA